MYIYMYISEKYCLQLSYGEKPALSDKIKTLNDKLHLVELTNTINFLKMGWGVSSFSFRVGFSYLTLPVYVENWRLMSVKLVQGFNNNAESNFRDFKEKIVYFTFIFLSSPLGGNMLFIIILMYLVWFEDVQ